MCTRRELPGLTGPVRQTQTSADRAWRGAALSAVEAGRIVRLLPTNCALLLRPNPPNVNRWSHRPQRRPDIAAKPVQLYRIFAARLLYWGRSNPISDLRLWPLASSASQV